MGSKCVRGREERKNAGGEGALTATLENDAWCAHHEAWRTVGSPRSGRPLSRIVDLRDEAALVKREGAEVRASGPS